MNKIQNRSLFFKISVCCFICLHGIYFVCLLFFCVDNRVHGVHHERRYKANSKREQIKNMGYIFGGCIYLVIQFAQEILMGWRVLASVIAIWFSAIYGYALSYCNQFGTVHRTHWISHYKFASILFGRKYSRINMVRVYGDISVIKAIEIEGHAALAVHFYYVLIHA